MIGGYCGQINLHLKKFARIRLHFMLDPVQPREFENGIFYFCHLLLGMVRIEKD